MRAFEAMNPAAVTVTLLLTACITIFCLEPVLLSVSLACAIAYYLLRNGRRNAAFHIGALGMPLLFALLNPLWNQHGETVLFIINQRAITQEALFYGGVTGLRLAAVFYWFRNFSDLMTSEKLFYLFRGFSPKLALIFTMAVRNLSLFRAQAKKIQTAQRALGLYREGHLIDDLRGGMRVFSILLTWALENGITAANSMSARGYGSGKRSSFTYFRWHNGDIVLLLMSLILAAFVIDAAFRGILTWQFYPQRIPPAVTLPYLAALAAYTALAMLPVIYEGKEVLTWHCLRRSI